MGEETKWCVVPYKMPTDKKYSDLSELTGHSSSHLEVIYDASIHAAPDSGMVAVRREDVELCIQHFADHNKPKWVELHDRLTQALGE